MTSAGSRDRAALGSLPGLEPHAIWDGVIARAVHGERLTLAVVELEPGGQVPEHTHANEQLGLVLSGSVAFRVGSEEQELGPGGTWRIESGVPHEVRAGPTGAVVVDVFAPPRDDWRAVERLAPVQPRWP